MACELVEKDVVMVFQPRIGVQAWVNPRQVICLAEVLNRQFPIALDSSAIDPPSASFLIRERPSVPRN